jgi:hypothetical protein
MRPQFHFAASTVIAFTQLLAAAEERPASPFGMNPTLPSSMLPPSNQDTAQPASIDESWNSSRLTISLDGKWRFAVDPKNLGLKENWQAAEYSDASWAWIETGKAWQQQGWKHAGYAWYRAQVFIPKECSGAALELKFGDVRQDDEVYFNGSYVGGMSGDYKYTPVAHSDITPRSYTVLPANVRYGEINSIAVRIWGSARVFRDLSGLLDKQCRIEIDPYRLMAVKSGGKAEEAVPVELFDMTAAQQSMSFDLVLPIPDGIVSKKGSQLAWTLGEIPNPDPTHRNFDQELFPASEATKQFASGRVELRPTNGTINRCVIPVDAATARLLYKNGCFDMTITLRDESDHIIYQGKRTATRLCYSNRDKLELPGIAATEHETPFGRLKLIDEIDASIPTDNEPHPYLESGFEAVRWEKVPGTPVETKVVEILGRKARTIEGAAGWFAYRIGRGRLIPGQAYLLRIEYPEDKARYCPIQVSTGLNNTGVGWKSGAGPDNPYDNWPLTNTWRWHDMVVVAGEKTLGSSGPMGAPGEFGFWVYFMHKVNGNYFKSYEAGPAVGRVQLYALDAKEHAPHIRSPQGLPSRTLMFDWENQPVQPPADMVLYARLMGYNTISPLLLKWAFWNFGEDMPGYDRQAVDSHGYYVQRSYNQQTGVGPDAVIPGVPSIHRQYLDATKNSGVRYLPRVEYGGSYDLPPDAKALGPDGKLMPPSRFQKWCGNLLHPAVWEDLKKLLDVQIKPFVASNPQLAGVLWRIRSDRMAASYGPADLELFSKETKTPLPPGDAASLGTWAFSGAGSEAYRNWWLEKRRSFHYRVRDLLTSYRSDLNLLYYNWDGDDFSIGLQDSHYGPIYRKIINAGNPRHEIYDEDIKARRKFTGDDYVKMIRTGERLPRTPEVLSCDKLNLDNAMEMDLYRDAGAMRPLAPVTYRFLADNPTWLNFFTTNDGLAVSHMSKYDELGRCSVDPHFECNQVTPGGGNFSMALEVLSYFHGDVRTLTWTGYTYGRGFAAEHRRFSQAFLALPAIPSAIVDQGNADLKVRTYTSTNGTYVGVAFKGYEGKKLTIKLPGIRANAKITDLVTNTVIPAKTNSEGVEFELESGPMELNSLLIN